MENPGTRVLIVGAGASGLALADKLLRAGITEVTILEKASEIGGTWRENRYPGVRCDVPARLYSLSSALNPHWTERFAAGQEIQDYLVRTVEQLGLGRLIRFDSEVCSSTWKDDHWVVDCADGHREEAEVLVTATGILHHPHTPDLPGLADFEGRVVHTAEWDDDLALDGKRIGVIGTGSTGAQVVGALAGVAQQLTVFQRTPQWMLPMPNASYSAQARWLRQRFPVLDRWSHDLASWTLERTLGAAVIEGGWRLALVSAVVRAHLRLAVRDKELRRRLTPPDRPMCRRLIMSTAFYRAVQRPDVELVTERIERITADGILTEDGSDHPLDILVTATGFAPHRYFRPMDVVGRDGMRVDDVWQEKPFAYRTVAVPGFPNFFMLLGPHSPIGNHSVISVAETQADFIVSRVLRLRSSSCGPAAPDEAATARYNQALTEAFDGSVWLSGCSGWYLGADGLPDLYPWGAAHHRALLSAESPEEWADC